MANGVHGKGRTEYPEAQRLLWIVSVLSRGGRVSSQCIRDRFEVSAATAWRDLRLVEELGYALELASDGPPRQWQLPRGPGRRLPTLAFTRNNLEMALLAVKGALAASRPSRRLKLVHLKLEILYSAMAPEPMVRLWRGIVAREQGRRETVRPADQTALRLAEAAVESVWCELDYTALGAAEPSLLQFAPQEVRGGRVYGFLKNNGRWESLDLERVLAVRLTAEKVRLPHAAPEPAPVAAEEADGEIRRAEQQVLRLIGLIRKLDRGHGVSPARLAEVFSTTLTTVKRDLDLLELSGYGIDSAVPEPGRKVYLLGDVGFHSVPQLPLRRDERKELESVLRAQLLCEPNSGLQQAAEWLVRHQEPELVLVTVEESCREESTWGTERLWSLVEAIAHGWDCVVWYEAHRQLMHKLRFRPQRFVFEIPLLVRGVLLPENRQRELLLPGIYRVELPGRTA